VLAGLASGGAGVGDADLVIGTSAGSMVGAWLGSGLPVEELYRRLTEAPLPGQDLTPSTSLAELTDLFFRLAEVADGDVDWRRRVCAEALAAETVPEHVRREIIAARLPVHAWPESELAIVAVDAVTAGERVFRRDSGVDLVDAVTASCAIPVLWPPVTIGGSRYVDGGIRSVTNADLAEGHDRVLILAPVSDGKVTRQAEALSESARVHVIEPDADSRAAIGTDVGDPATRLPAARTGHAQGAAVASAVADMWQKP
jgi:NTE family protein